MRRSLLIHPGELDEAWVRRAKNLSLDILALHPEGGTSADRSLLNLLERLKTPEFQALLEQLAAAGIAVEYEFHVGRALVPREEFAAHPDYFRMDEAGQRTPDLNFCPSNPAARSMAAKRAVELQKNLYLSSNRSFFWLDDVAHGRCHCPKCRDLSASDQQLLVINDISAALRQENPDAKVAFLAYHETLKTPEVVKPAPGVFLEYADIGRDQSVPVRNFPEKHGEIRRLLNFFPGEAQVLEYWYDNSLFSHWVKPPVPFAPHSQVIRDDLAFYEVAGFETAACFACFLGSDYTQRYGEPDFSDFAR